MRERHPPPIAPADFESSFNGLRVTELAKSLPPGLGEEGFIRILKFAYLTEAATETYAQEIAQVARDYEQDWLGEFNERVWTPDEMTHRLPYRGLLLQMDVPERELDLEEKEAQERDYTHLRKHTPMYVTSFGTYQEGLTDFWHGQIATLLAPTNPEAARDVLKVKKRETLHEMWYADMSALQLDDNPKLMADMIDALLQFNMPYNEIVPQLADKLPEFIEGAEIDLRWIKKHIIDLTYQILQKDPEQAGKLVLQAAAKHGIKLGPINARHLAGAFSKFGGAGRGIFGEALLESVGYEGFKARDSGMTGRIRSIIRTFTAGQIGEAMSGMFLDNNGATNTK